MTEFKRDTTGFTADVEQYDGDTLVKVYRDYVPQADIDREILCTEAVQGQDLPVPVYRGAIEYQGKRAILLEYIRGESMSAVMNTGKKDLVEIARDFAAVHYRMHQCRMTVLEPSKDRYERLLRRSEPQLGSDLMNRCLKLLETLPDGDRLSHNDYHPGNLIYGQNGLICIDWSDASQGDPLADVARTVQMFDYGPTACSGTPMIPRERISPETIARFESYRSRIRVFTREYEQEYVRMAGMSFEEYERLVEPWKVVVPASRFWTEWDCNKPQILKMMYKYFMAHSM